MTNKKIPAENKSTKDTLYIDVEDEITAVIDKLVSSTHKIIAVVLPKRATVFQSIVNMKLLKKAALAHKKNMVLITSDPAVLPIAATVGIHVAKTPSSKPEIPVIEQQAVSDEVVYSQTVEKKSQPESSKQSNSDSSKTAAASGLVDDADETIELDNTDDASDVEIEKPKKVKKGMKIPNFSSFSVRLTLGIILVILLITSWVFGFIILPKATVTVTTDISSATVNAVVTAKVGATDLSVEDNILPAQRAQVEKIDEASVPATGEKNIGQKASGRMNLENCIKSDGQQIIPTGTRFSAGSITFETTEQAILPEATFSGSGQCRSKDNGNDKTVDVLAVESGSGYNVGAQNYNSAISGINASGSAMGGGTTEIVTVISDVDVENAKKQLSGTSKAAALDELKKELATKNVRPIEESLFESDPVVDVTPAVGAEAKNVTVKTTRSYALIGVTNEDIAAILENEVKNDLVDKDKNIRDNGLEAAKFLLIERPDDASHIFTLETVASIGPDIDVEAVKQDIAGNKRGEIEKKLEAIDGVRSVSVEYSPAWITTTPKSASKIEIIFDEQDNR